MHFSSNNKRLYLKTIAGEISPAIFFVGGKLAGPAPGRRGGGGVWRLGGLRPPSRQTNRPGRSPGRLCARSAPAAPPAGQAPDLPQDEKAARGYAPGRWMPVEKRRAAPQSWGKSLI